MQLAIFCNPEHVDNILQLCERMAWSYKRLSAARELMFSGIGPVNWFSDKFLENINDNVVKLNALNAKTQKWYALKTTRTNFKGWQQSLPPEQPPPAGNWKWTIEFSEANKGWEEKLSLNLQFKQVSQTAKLRGYFACQMIIVQFSVRQPHITIHQICELKKAKHSRISPYYHHCILQNKQHFAIA